MTLNSDDNSSSSPNIYIAPNTPLDANITLPQRSREVLEEIPTHDEDGYSIREEPMGTKQKVRIIVQGAGASALNFLKKAGEELELVDVVCYEKNVDVGGTWYENRYPGCACDIPSVNYQFTWKIKIWEHYYASSREIWEYLKDIEQEGQFIAKGQIKTRHEILGADWDDSAGLWRLQIKNLESGEAFEDTCEFFINAGGVLNNWKWPDIPGLDSFTGKLMHTANYDRAYPLAGKRVAVLGAGSSGVQCVANIQKDVAHLYHWIRSPIWITSGFAQTWAGKDGGNFAYTDEQKRYLEANPQKYLEYRKQIESELNQRFRFIIKGSPEATQARDFAEQEMRRKLASAPHLADKIVPKNFNVGCRRPTPAPGYLEALVAPNVTVFTSAVGGITPTGFTDHEGNAHEIDVLICATGFDTSWVPRFPVTARGRSLADLWDPANGGVTSYLAVGVPTFPNYFSFCGPYGPLGHGSFMPLIESWTRYIFSAVRKLQVENLKSMTPKMEAAEAFRRHADLFLKRTAWTMPCRSWFKQGKVEGQAAIWPGSRVQYLEVMGSVRWEDYELEWKGGNRFAWLGNGWCVREGDGRDITDYLGLLPEKGEEEEDGGVGADEEHGVGVDKQPIWDDTLKGKLAGWAVGL